MNMDLKGYLLWMFGLKNPYPESICFLLQVTMGSTKVMKCDALTKQMEKLEQMVALAFSIVSVTAMESCATFLAPTKSLYYYANE